MLLGRRIKPGWQDRLRTFVWPDMGPRRAALYVLKRISRLDASPHAIAAGLAAGTAVSFTPFLGAHFAMSFVLAWLVRGNLLAAAFGTIVGNPLTFPLFFAATYQTGRLILGQDGVTPPLTTLTDAALPANIGALWPMIETMAVGALPLGALAFGSVYLVARSMVSGFQKARHARRARRLGLRRNQLPRVRRHYAVDRATAQPSR